MHKEEVKYYGHKGKLQECEADTFDTVVHLNRGYKHAIKDIECLLKEEQVNKRKGIR